jgi:hypothetical protein
VTPSAILRIVAAAAALVSGYAHLSLYNDGYKDIPSDFGGIGPLDIGAQFLLNAIGALLIAIGLVAPLVVKSMSDAIWKLAAVVGAVWAALSLIAFYFAHETDGGWFDFTDGPGLKPSPEAAMSVFSEVIVLVAVIAMLALTVRPRRARTEV